MESINPLISLDEDGEILCSPFVEVQTIIICFSKIYINTRHALARTQNTTVKY